MKTIYFIAIFNIINIRNEVISGRKLVVRKMKIVFNAPVILAFIFISFIVLLLGIITGGRSTKALFMTYHSSLLSPLTYIRFFTHVLGHANWEHYISNAAYLLLLGPMLEEKYGSKQLLYVILITAVITALFNYVVFWNVALCGASGVVFAFILLTSFTSFRTGEIPITFILVAVIFIGQQIAEGLIVRDNISNISHIIGGIIGATIGYKLNKKSR